MKNHWLEGMLEKGNITLPWNLKRVRLLDSLIEPTAQFCIELETKFVPPSIFDYDCIVEDHLNGSCDPKKVGT